MLGVHIGIEWHMVDVCLKCIFLLKSFEFFEGWGEGSSFRGLKLAEGI